MNYILFDGEYRDNLLPLTYTKPVADLRIGILTIREKWEKYLGFTTTTITEEYLSEKFPMVEMEQNIMINASVLPTPGLVAMINELKASEAIYKSGELIAFFSKENQEIDFETFHKYEYAEDLIQIKHSWDLFSFNGEALESDFDLITEGRESAPIPDTVHCMNKDRIFLEEDVEIEIGVLNANKGAIYIGKHAQVMEGSYDQRPICYGRTFGSENGYESIRANNTRTKM